MENNCGGQQLFNGLASHLGAQRFTLVDTNYANNLKFIKNQPLKIKAKWQNN